MNNNLRPIQKYIYRKKSKALWLHFVNKLWWARILGK